MVTLLLLLLLITIQVSQISTSHETALRKKILSNYDKTSIPNVLTKLEVGFTILGITLDEENEILLLDTWIRMQWNDPRLKWDENDYPDIKALAFPAESLWLPDLTLYNNVKWSTLNHIANHLPLVYPDGKILHIPRATLPATCVYDMTYWPHDTQRCKAKLGSWVYSGFSINLTKAESGVAVNFNGEKIHGSEEDKNSATGILSTGDIIIKGTSVDFVSKYYSCCPEPYPSVTVTLVLERNAPLYNWIVKVPAIVLAILTGVLFLLSSEYSGKMIFGVILLLADVIYLFYLTSIVKHSPSHTPLIVKFAGEQMIFTLLAVVLCCFIVRITKTPHKDSLPRIVNKLVNVLQKPLCLSGYYAAATEKLEVDKESMVEKDDLNDTSEWILLGAVIDRILLLLYFVIFFIRLAAYASIFLD